MLINLLIAICCCLTGASESERPLQIASVVTKQLHFLIIGDWGKGGTNGVTWNAVGNKHRKRFRKSEGFENHGDGTKEVIQTSFSSTANDKNSGGKQQQVTNQAHVANAMAAYASASYNNPPTFVVTTGDNFYTKGVQSATDLYWDYLWSNVYLIYNSLSTLPWYPVVGNHDWGYGLSGIQAQVDRTKLYPNGLWQMPSTNYSKSFSVGNDATLLMLFIDTTTLAPSLNKCCNSNG